MHLVRFTHQGETRAGVITSDRVTDVGVLGCPATIEGWLETSLEIRTELEAAVTAGPTPAFALKDVRIEVRCCIDIGELVNPTRGVMPTSDLHSV